MRFFLWLPLSVLLVLSSAAASDLSWLGEGEKLTYTLSYLHVVAGTLELSAQPEGDNLRLTMSATSTPGFSRIFPVNNRMETLLSRNPLSLLRQEASIAEGKRRFSEVLVVDPATGVATRTRDGHDKGQVRVRVPVLDTLGAIFALRSLDLAPSRAFSLDVISGKEVLPLAVVVTGRQTVKTGPARAETFVVEPRFRSGGLYKNESQLVLYVTQDPRHIPLKIVSRLPFGSLTATLVEVSPPWQGVVEWQKRETGVKDYGTETR